MTADDSAPLAPSEAFAVLSDQTRIAIVEALAEESGLAFAELRKRVGVADAGQFNYHLSKLRDRFVIKRDGEYHPQYAALRAVGAIRAGTYTGRRAAETADADHACLFCEAPMTVTYEDGRLFWECSEHGKVSQTFVPPGLASDRSFEELVSYANAEVQRDVERAVDGNCPVCSGSLSSSTPERAEGLLQVNLSCQDCWNNVRLPVAASVVRHPAVVSLYYDHGVDIRRETLLLFNFVRDPESATVISEDPLRMRVAVEHGDDALALTLDGDLNVLEVRES